MVSARASIRALTVVVKAANVNAESLEELQNADCTVRLIQKESAQSRQVTGQEEGQKNVIKSTTM